MDYDYDPYDRICDYPCSTCEPYVVWCEKCELHFDSDDPDDVKENGEHRCGE
jgi:hypothetical protein